MAFVLMLTFMAQPVAACTGITLVAKDGAVMFARTMEWGTFNLRSNFVVTPQAIVFTCKVGSDQSGITWTTKYGGVGLDFIEMNYLFDGMNRKGLAVTGFITPAMPIAWN